MRAHTAPKLYMRGDVWWCYWRDERWSTKQTDRTQAERIVAERYSAVHQAAREKGIDDAVVLYLEALDRRGRADATKRIARQKIGHFRRLWAGRSLASIDYKTVAEYVRTRIDDERAARLTVSHELGHLRQAWKLARAQGWCPRAWDELMPERFDRGYRPRTRWLTAEELRSVLASLPDAQAAWVAWVVATGSDVGDVSRAQAGDLDWRRGLVRVRGTKTVFRDRYVPITALTRPLLKLAEQHGPPFEPWPWVNGALRKLAIRIGIPHFTPKDLRRTHGQWLRSAGVDPHLIGRVLGHADSAMADRVYAQGDEGAIARLVRDAVGRVRMSERKRTSRVRIDGTSGHRRASAARGTRRK